MQMGVHNFPKLIPQNKRALLPIKKEIGIPSVNVKSGEKLW
jgi:hypothetical protein